MQETLYFKTQPHLSHRFLLTNPVAKMNNSLYRATTFAPTFLSFALRFSFLIKPRFKTQLSTQERPKHQLYVQEETKREIGLKDQQGSCSN